ncbi:MAG: hypothetical protein HKN70_08635 [Gammaproteobacteria bacterium]|nr:hypothetical protein [Gammaproteobacteria bacterium]
MRLKITTIIAVLVLSNPVSAADAGSDIPQMINKMMPFAEEFLVDYGEFFPFGGAMKSDGEVVTISGTDGMGSQPESQDVIETVKYTLQIGAANQQYRATALVYKVNVLPPGKENRSDAVAIEIDHADGYSAVLVFPYKIKDNTVTFGDVFARGGQNAIFVSPASQAETSKSGD